MLDELELGNLDSQDKQDFKQHQDSHIDKFACFNTDVDLASNVTIGAEKQLVENTFSASSNVAATNST